MTPETSLVGPTPSVGSVGVDGRSPIARAFAPWRTRSILAFIESRLGDGIRMRDVVGLMQLSTGHFSRAFKATFGTTFSVYVVRRRLQRAQALMLESDLTLSEIASQCGFADQAHLTRQFRRSFETSPNRWRKDRRDALERASVRAPRVDEAMERREDGRAES
jgi:AraC-like DNA-binding protein